MGPMFCNVTLNSSVSPGKRLKPEGKSIISIGSLTSIGMLMGVKVLAKVPTLKMETDETIANIVSTFHREFLKALTLNRL